MQCKVQYKYWPFTICCMMGQQHSPLSCLDTQSLSIKGQKNNLKNKKNFTQWLININLKTNYSKSCRPTDRSVTRCNCQSFRKNPIPTNWQVVAASQLLLDEIGCKKACVGALKTALQMHWLLHTVLSTEKTCFKRCRFYFEGKRTPFQVSITFFPSFTTALWLVSKCLQTIIFYAS